MLNNEMILSMMRENDFSFVDDIFVSDLNNLTYNLISYINVFSEPKLCLIQRPNIISEIRNIIIITNTIYEYYGISIVDDDIYDLIQNIYTNATDDSQLKDYIVLDKDQSLQEITLSKVNENTTKEENQIELNNNGYGKIHKNLLMRFDPISNYEDVYVHHKGDVVGTLDKVKEVKFIVNDSGDPDDVSDNISYLNRDFFGKHIKDGLIDPNIPYDIITELKYDGMSIECTIQNGFIVSALTRGDLTNSKGVNKIKIFADRYFIRSKMLLGEDYTDVVQFEAIMSYDNLQLYNIVTGSNYVNPRTAISGLLNRNDAFEYKEFITLMPLYSKYIESITESRMEEINLLNEIYGCQYLAPYQTFKGIIPHVVEMINQEKDIIQSTRNRYPFMFDGIVISYNDRETRKRIGRKGFINKYAVALKLNAINKLTTYRGCEFTVGKDGRITPMAYFDVVLFMNTMHRKATMHSYRRYKELGLREGETVSVTYVNDCMPYIDKYESLVSDTLDVIHCPACGNECVPNGDMLFCINKSCVGIAEARMVSCLDKLGFNGMGEAFIRTTKLFRLSDILSVTPEYLQDCGFGPQQINNIIGTIRDIRTTPKFDYNLLGSIGFTNTGATKFKALNQIYDIDDLINLYKENRLIEISEIPGIGKSTVEIINMEFDSFIGDILKSRELMNIVSSKRTGVNPNARTIRFSGVRDKELINNLSMMGHDISDGSLINSTNYLVVPYIGFTSSKTKKAEKLGINIVTIEMLLEILEAETQI